MFENNNRSKEWNCNAWNARYAGKEAKCLCDNGYLKISIKKDRYLAHRIVWALYYGEDPVNTPDHINGLRNDNRINNLRDATRTEQSRNSRINKNNTTGVTGVSFNKRLKLWEANIGVNYKKIHLGWFDNFCSAVGARQAAEVKYFGEFRRLDNAK